MIETTHTEKVMIHLSLTGWGAAQQRRLCTTPVVDGDTNWHAMECSDAQLADPRICAACLRRWQDDDNKHA